MQGSINFDGSLVGNITGGGGGGGDTVVITPVVTSGTKIADVSVNGVEKDLYCPTPPAPTEVDITPVVTSGTKIADVSVGGVEKDLYTPDYETDIAALDGRLDTTEGNITSLTGRVGTAEGNITEIKQSLSQLDGLIIYKDLTPTDDYAEFDDGSSLPLISLISTIEPIQSGSGTPSPENVRPISGWDECNVSVCGSNIIGLGTELKGYTDGSLKFVVNLNSTGYYFETAKLPDTITFNCMNGNRAFFAYYNSVPAANVVAEVADKTSSTLPRTITIDKSYKYIHIQMSFNQATTNNQVCVGSELQPYAPYNGQTYTIDLDGTRYGGVVDVVSGVLTLTHGYIASYNGETLPSTWISDRDVYAEGTTPTTGAEVVYELATPLTIQFTPTEVDSLLGQNYINSDTGDITNVKYLGVLNLS